MLENQGSCSSIGGRVREELVAGIRHVRDGANIFKHEISMDRIISHCKKLARVNHGVRKLLIKLSWFTAHVIRTISS